MATHQHIAFLQLKRPLVVNSNDTRVTLHGQREIDDDDVIINITGKEDNSIFSNKGGQDQPAEISSDGGFEDD